MTFINLKIFPSVVNALGLHYVFWIHGAMCIVICILAALLLPETGGKSLKELSELYKTRPTHATKINIGKESFAKGI